MMRSLAHRSRSSTNTASSLRPSASLPFLIHVSNASRSTPLIWLRDWASSASVRHISSTTRPSPTKLPTSSASARRAPSRCARCDMDRTARRMMLRSNRSSTDLIRPSNALAWPDVHALNQTTDTAGSAASVASNRCMSVLLPMPQTASTASVNGADARDAMIRSARLRATSVASSRSSSAPSPTGASLSTTNRASGPTLKPSLSNVGCPDDVITCRF